MHNPCLGIVTSEHEDDGGYKHHRGRDIGTRILGPAGPAWVYGVGKPVYAAFSGRWKKIVRWSKPGNRKSTWAPTRTGNGGLVANPDGEGNGYNHVRILDKWDEGDWINEGELIGHLDLSGNMTAPHLHFEMWLRWQDPYSDYSPKIVFDKYGVSTLDDPAAPSLGFASNPATSSPKEDTLSAAEVNEIKAHVTAEVNRAMDLIIQRTTVEVIRDGKKTTRALSTIANNINRAADTSSIKTAVINEKQDQISKGLNVILDSAAIKRVEAEATEAQKEA